MNAFMTVRDFLVSYHSAHLAKPTLADYLIQVGHFEHFLAQRDPASPKPALADLTVANIRGAMDWQLQRGRAKPTADKLRRGLLAIRNKAIELDFGDLVPFPPKKLRPLRLPKREPIAWTIEEFERMLLAASDLSGEIGPWPRAKVAEALLWLTYNSGLRISAVMATKWTWLEFSQRRLVVDPEVQKDDEGATVILLPETIAALRAIQPPTPKRTPGVFDCWPYDRGVQQWPALNGMLKKILVAAGLAANVNEISRRELWHKIRRTFATAIYLKCRDIEVVREMLGHSDPAVTWRYIDKSQLTRKTQADLLPTPNPTRLRIYTADRPA